MAVKPYFEKDGVALFHGDCLEVLPLFEGVDIDRERPRSSTI